MTELEKWDKPLVDEERAKEVWTAIASLDEFDDFVRLLMDSRNNSLGMASVCIKEDRDLVAYYHGAADVISQLVMDIRDALN